MSKTILVTGANGFIGSNLLLHLKAEGYSVVKCVRSLQEDCSSEVLYDDFLDLDKDLQFQIDVVIHLAAIVHSHDALESDVFRVNTDLTKLLVLASEKRAVKKFIFLSSVSVYGGQSNNERLKETFALAPRTTYGLSKLKAEQEIQSVIERQDEMVYVIIRPPLVYGPNAPGNFQKLLWLSTKNIPVPFMNASNLRSFVSIANLADFIKVCVSSDKANNEKFHVSDGYDLSTREMFELICTASNRKPLMWSIPKFILKGGANFLGMRRIYESLFGSFRLDISHAQNTLGWQPKESFKDVVRDVVVSYLHKYSSIRKKESS